MGRRLVTGRQASVMPAVLLVLFAALVVWYRPAVAQTVTPAWAVASSSGVAAVTAAVGDAGGNVYVGGTFSGPTLTLGSSIMSYPGGDNTILTMFFAKYDASGSIVWAKTFGGNLVDGSPVTGIAVDSGGNVYFTGYFVGSDFDVGGTILSPSVVGAGLVAGKLNPDGSTAWAKSFGTIPSATTYGRAIALDPANNPVIAGTYQDGSTSIGAYTLPAPITSGQGILFAKLDGGNGDVTWAQGYVGAGTFIAASGLVVAATGNIYASGTLSGGSVTIGNTISSVGDQDLWLAQLSSAGVPAWSKGYGGAGTSVIVPSANLAADSGENIYLTGSFSGGSLDVGGTTLTQTTGSNSDMLAIKATAGGNTVWAQNWGMAGADSQGIGIGRDAADNIYVAGVFNGASLSLGGITLTLVGSSDLALARLSGSNGTAVWARSYGGTGTAVGNPGGPAGPVAIAGTGRVVASGYYASGTLSFGTTTLPSPGSQAMYVAEVAQTYGLTTSVSGAGRVTSTPSGISCGSSCSGQFEAGMSVTLAAAATGADVFRSWSGDCSGSAATLVVTMNAARNCIATFGAAPPSGGGAAPVPPPAFVSPSQPPPPIIVANATGSGEGTVSIASSFVSGVPLTFEVRQVSGAPLPDWLTFNPATGSFSYKLPQNLLGTVPIQTVADRPAPRAGTGVANTVYPLSALVQTVPISLTATAGGQSYTTTINMDFYAPRPLVALTGVSYSPSGASGNAASARPALSWDGGQIVFETLAGNINPASGTYSSIARYDGLSGRRDLLSQTAVPGGGVANGVDGNSNNPAVAASGNHAAFSSSAPGVSTTPNNRLRQVYRTSLAYPRVSLNEAATPAAVMVSATAAGIAADAAADMPAMSEHGEFVAFESAAGNLGPNPDSVVQVWRKTMDTGAIALVSAAAGGTPGNGDSRNVSLSWDGRFAVFDSIATNLVFGNAAGRQVYLKDLDSGRMVGISTAAGAGNARIDARATSVVYVAPANGRSQVMRYDIAAGTTTLVSMTPSGVAGNGDSTQAAVSADGRFVVFRSTATDLAAAFAGNGQAQIWVRDVMLGTTALVSRTATGAPGNGAASDPALSGDGASIAFTSQATNLVDAGPLPGQVYMAANPLVLPGRTAYWYAVDGGNQAWTIERWGARALVAGLGYQPGGPATWIAGTCDFTGLACGGRLNQWTAGGAARPAADAVLTFAADGRSATLSLGNGAPARLAIYPIGGPATTGYAGLPQAGYWVADGTGPGVSSLFLDIDTQAAPGGGVVQVVHATLFGYDAQGAPTWYAAEGPMATDTTFSAQLNAYGGGAPFGQTTGAVVPSATPVGVLRLTFTATDRATMQTPDGRTLVMTRARL